MIVSKSFKKISSLTAWLNRPENSNVNVITILPDGEEFSIIYSAGHGQDLTAMRCNALCRKSEALVKVPKASKKAMHYPAGIQDFEVAPLTRLHNSLRNLKAFAGVPYDGITKFIIDNLDSVGFRHLDKNEAKIEYGAGIELIEKQRSVEP